MCGWSRNDGGLGAVTMVGEGRNDGGLATVPMVGWDVGDVDGEGVGEGVAKGFAAIGGLAISALLQCAIDGTIPSPRATCAIPVVALATVARPWRWLASAGTRGPPVFECVCAHGGGVWL